MYKLIIKPALISFIFFISTYAVCFSNEDFNSWLKNFKNIAINKGVSIQTVNVILSDAKFLPKVIEYDRYQPEFYEDTYTYIKKRANQDRVKKGLTLYKKEKEIINKIEDSFEVEKELLLALMGIETNFG